MSDLYKNPAKEPQSPKPEHRPDDHMDWGGTRMLAVGPGGKTTILDHNEKGILETGLFEAMGFHQEAALGSNHDSYAVGIYASTDSKLAD